MNYKKITKLKVQATTTLISKAISSNSLIIRKMRELDTETYQLVNHSLVFPLYPPGIFCNRLQVEISVDITDNNIKARGASLSLNI